MKSDCDTTPQFSSNLQRCYGIVKSYNTGEDADRIQNYCGP